MIFGVLVDVSNQRRRAVRPRLTGVIWKLRDGKVIVQPHAEHPVVRVARWAIWWLKLQSGDRISFEDKGGRARHIEVYSPFRR
jgi:hypothetical protein